MPFFRENRDALHLAAMAAALVAGVRLAFAFPEVAGFWHVFAYTAVMAFLAAWGYGVRGLCLPAVLLFGMISAFRTDNARMQVIDRNAGLHGRRPPLVLSVEGGVTEWWRKRDGARCVSFMSHAGPLPLRVVMPLREDRALPKVGEKWRCSGFISNRETRRFSPHTLWVAAASNSAERVACAGALSPAAVYAAWSDELARRAGIGLDWCGELADFNRAILLGRRGGLSRERREMFAAAGTIHVFAISGLHVMVVAWLISGLLRRFDVPLRAQGLVAVPLLVAYTMLTGARPSAVRAAFMASLCLLAPTAGRRPDSLAAWSVTAMAVYGLRPENVFDVGCTLSFAVMLGIVLWSNAVRHMTSPFTFTADKTIGWHRRSWREKGASLAADLLQSLCISVAAWVVSVPVTACVFRRFTVGGLLANVVLMACAGKMVKAGAAGVAASFLCVPLGAVLNNAAACFTGAMVRISEWTASLPWASVEVKPWGIWTCIAWYAAWLAAFAMLCQFWPSHVFRSRQTFS